MAVAFFEPVPQAIARRPLTEADAVDIWIARWLRIRRKDLVRRYGCDPRRLYEIWEETRFAGAAPRRWSCSRAATLRCSTGSISDRISGTSGRPTPINCPSLGSCCTRNMLEREENKSWTN